MDRLPSDETSQQRGLPPVEASVQSPVVGLHSGNKRAFARDRQIPHTPCKREPLDHSAPITQHRPNLQRPEASIPVSPREVTGRAIVFEPNDVIQPSQSRPGRSEIVDLTVSPTPELSEEHYSSRDNGQQEDAVNHPALSQAAESHEQQGCLPREIVKEVLRLAYSEEMVQGHVKTGNMINLACIWCHKDGRFPDGRLAKAHNLYIFNDGARKQPVLSACDNINEAIKSRKELAASLDSTFIKGNNFNAVHVNLKDSGACLFVPQESELKEEIFKELEIAQSQRTWSGKEKTLSLAGKGRTVNVALRESLFSANMFKETLGWFDKSRDQATTRDPRESHDALSQAAAPHHATNGMPSLDNAENNATESLVNRHDVADMEDGEILPHVQQNHSAGAAPPMPQAKRQKSTSSHDQSSAGTGQNIANLPTEQVGEGLDASLSMQVEHAQEIQNNTSGTAFTDEALGQDEHDREISFNVGMQAQQEYSTPQIAYRAVVLGQPIAETEHSIATSLSLPRPDRISQSYIGQEVVSRQDYNALKSKYNQNKERLKAAEEDGKHLKDCSQRLSRESKRLLADRKVLLKERDTLEEENRRICQERDTLEEEKKRICQERDALEKENRHICQEIGGLQDSFDAIRRWRMIQNGIPIEE
jgi:hypothetical protein